jgi:hypothetical protein
MSNELFDYCQLFDILELELLPGENPNDDDIIGNAIVEYYNYLFYFVYLPNECPEFKNGIQILRKLLFDLSTSKHSHINNVWKAMAEVKDDESLLRIAFPLIKYMWD